MFTDTNAFSLFSRISDMVFCSLTLLKDCKREVEWAPIPTKLSWKTILAIKIQKKRKRKINFYELLHILKRIHSILQMYSALGSIPCKRFLTQYFGALNDNNVINTY